MRRTELAAQLHWDRRRHQKQRGAARRELLLWCESYLDRGGAQLQWEHSVRLHAVALRAVAVAYRTASPERVE